MKRLLVYMLNLTLTGLAAYGAYEAYTSAMDGQRIDRLKRDINSIRQEVIAQQRQGAPASQVKRGNPFDGSYSILFSSQGSATPLTTFSVIADNIPESDCEQIIKSFGAGGGLAGGPFYGYAVTATNAGGGAVSPALPDTDGNARTNCAAPGTAAVAIQFVLNG